VRAYFFDALAGSAPRQEHALSTVSELRKLVANQLARAAVEARGLAAMRRAGIIGVDTPANLARSGRALLRFGTVGGGLANAAIRHPEVVGLRDDLGSLTFREMDERANALANGLAAEGLGERAVIGVLCRNHRGLVDLTFGGSKAGFKLIYLNTDFAGPQARDVCAREGVQALVVDEEFLPVVEGVESRLGTFVAWHDAEPDADGLVHGKRTLGSLVAASPVTDPKAPKKEGTIVILTSGTTGLPKGAPRAQPKTLAAPGAILTRIPFHENGSVFVAPPLFHAWGLFMGIMTVATGSTLVLTRRFDPAEVLDTLAEHRCTGLIVVPVMLNRMLDLDDGGPAARDLGSLRFIASSGSQLEAPLATATMDAFGDILYNLYGSTEVAYATIATPEDMRAAPGCVGKPALATTIRLVGDDGRDVGPGETGRVFVGNDMAFDGYTGGGDKERIDGLVATGDVGHFDGGGRLVIDGRDDDMIVSGGENVFPGEVETLLDSHPDILEAAVIGVPDETMGQRLRAFVVCRHDASLTEAEVRAHVKANLARYKVPKSVTFLDELPRNPTGKVLKRQLRDLP